MEVVLVGLGRPEQAGFFCEQHEIPFACVVRPDRAAHKAYGLRRGTLNQTVGPAVWAPWLRNQVTGKRQTGWGGQGDVAQLAGTFVVDTDGVIRYAYRGERSSDLAPTEEVLGAASGVTDGDG